MRNAAFALILALQLQAQTTQPTTSATPAVTPPPTVCPAGGPLGDVDLRVQSPRGQAPLPLRTINRLSEGDTVLYAPLLRGKTKRHGEVALVLAPAVRQPNSENLFVSDPKPADRPEEWKIGQTIAVAAFVYSAEGLNKKKVKGFLSQDDLLIAQLADYAEKTAQTEALIQALESNGTSAASVNAALSGFASQYGLGVQIDRTAPPGAQANALFQTLNPALASYDPLQPSAMAKYGQTASVATAVATLFFGNPVGLAAGGTAMLLDLKALAFPGTQFRSSFAVPLAEEKGLNLCGPVSPAPPHTRVAYIWATRIPNSPAPHVTIGKASYLPLKEKTTLPVDVPDSEWKYLERSRSWTIEDEKGQEAAVTVVKLANQKSLELDLSKVSLGPGEYHLQSHWDWQTFTADGLIHLSPLSDLKNARLEPVSQDKLIAKSGKVPITVAGDDFEFTTKVEIKKIGDEFATTSAVPFKLPKGLREGPQNQMDVQINTGDLDPGTYSLFITQEEDKPLPVTFKILPSLTKIANLPLHANQGLKTQEYVLQGEHLDLISRLETKGATVDLSSDISNSTERKLTLHLDSSPPAGSMLEMKAYLKDRSEPLTFADAIQVTGPLPAITASTPSPPAGMDVSLHEGEFPAGFTLSASLQVKNVKPGSALRLGCVGDDQARLSLHSGEQSDKESLQPIGRDQFFLSFDTSSWPAGCSIEATLDNGTGGRSQPFNLGHVVRLPAIDKFVLSDEDAGNGMKAGSLSGRNLETIEKVGWDAALGIDVLGLPSPIPGQGQKQSLRIQLPPQPNAQSTLFLWLRGESVGRKTTIAPAPDAATTAQTRSHVALQKIAQSAKACAPCSDTISIK